VAEVAAPREKVSIPRGEVPIPMGKASIPIVKVPIPREKVSFAMGKVLIPREGVDTRDEGGQNQAQKGQTSISHDSEKGLSPRPSAHDGRLPRHFLQLGLLRHPLAGAEGAFPAGDDDRGQAVADDVDGGAGHVHELVDAEDERHALER